MNWSHPVLPRIVLFQNLDAIIGPEEPIIYPEGMTNEIRACGELRIGGIGLDLAGPLLV